MSTGAVDRGVRRRQTIDGLPRDWVMVVLCTWFLGGVYLDGWAHTHGKVDESFFTPWHAVFYSGFLVVAGFLAWQVIRRRASGYPRPWALPSGYGLALVGALIFVCGGIGDMIWHELFGIEEDVEALYSPTHLLLVLGMWLMVSAPFGAAWQRMVPRSGWKQLAPMLLSLAFMLSVGTFITQIAHPLANLWGGGLLPRSPIWLFEEMGVVSLLFDAGLLMGFILLALRRWTLPPGALTLVVTCNAIAMGFLYHHGAYPLLHVAARAAAGAVADVILSQLRPSLQRLGALRLFAFVMPALISAFYFLTLQMAQGMWWSIHLWAGVIVLTGVTGLLLSYLLVPPPIPTGLQDVA